jgi:hypothetical protein
MSLVIYDQQDKTGTVQLTETESKCFHALQMQERKEKAGCLTSWFWRFLANFYDIAGAKKAYSIQVSKLSSFKEVAQDESLPMSERYRLACLVETFDNLSQGKVVSKVDPAAKKVDVWVKGGRWFRHPEVHCVYSEHIIVDLTQQTIESHSIEYEDGPGVVQRLQAD